MSGDGQPPTPPPPKRWCRWVWAALVLTLATCAAGLYTGVPAIVCGHVARARIKRFPEQLRGASLAAAMLALAYVATAMEGLGLAFLHYAPGSSHPPVALSVPEELLASWTSTEDMVRACFEPLVPAQDPIALVVGIISNGERTVQTVGAAPHSGQTIFEIGSVTKPFTGLCLAALAEAGEVDLQDPIGKYLPPSAVAPKGTDRPVHLVDLATQTSGLPRLPPNISLWAGFRYNLAGVGNPYEGYGRTELLAGLERTQLTQAPGALYVYSNFGVGLLGELLSTAADEPYPALVQSRVCTPLGLTSTFVSVPANARDRLAPGHLTHGRRMAPWELGALAGAGGIHSTVDDLLTFLAVYLEPDRHPELAGAIRLSVTPHFRQSEGMSLGLCWHGRHDGDGDTWWHNGATGGYAAFVAFHQEAGVAVAALCNADVSDPLTAAGFTCMTTLIRRQREP